MRLLVCGSRSFRDEVILDAVLTGLLWANPYLVLIEGEQVSYTDNKPTHGADYLAAKWATRQFLEKGRRHLPFPARWSTLGKRAGYVRNRQMLDEGQPTHGLAFVDKPLEDSKGTANMVQLMEDAGLPVRVIISTESILYDIAE